MHAATLAGFLARWARMARLAAVAIVAIAVACSSASAPTTGFSGTWKGTTGVGANYAMTVSQHDSTISGKGTLQGPSTSVYRFTVTGSSMNPNLSLRFAFGDTDDLIYSGTYITPDSVAGAILVSPSVGVDSLSLKRQ
jgi:hypothetical protein